MNKRCLLFVFVPWLALPTPLYSQAEQPREHFSKAYLLFSQGNHSQAETLFLKTLDQDYLLYDYSLYFLGKIASARGAWDSARNYFRQLGERFPQSLWSSYAGLELAKIALAEKNYSQAFEELRALRSKGVRNTISNEALYLTGQIHELQGNVEQAYSVYQELRRAAADLWAAKARTEVHRLREQQPQLFALTSPEQLSNEGDLLFRERRFREAEGIYRKLLELNPEGYSRPSLLMNLASVYHAAWKRDEGIPVLAEIVREYPESPEAPRALYRLARAYWNRDEDLKALDHLKQLKERYPKDPVMDYADFISARIYESSGKTDEAKSIYDGFAKRFPGSRLRQEAEWR
ncbi:MAG: tetratricopeptide repeat protein, partial [Candidatus Binatia bacterium]